MSAEILKIVDFMGEAFLHIWPYLLVTIPVAAVWSLVSHRIFALYVSYVLVGAVVMGYLRLVIN